MENQVDKKKKKGDKITIEISKKGLIIVAIAIVAIILIFVLSNNLGNRSNDKSGSGDTTTTEAEANPLLEDGQVLNEAEMLSEVPEINYEEFTKALNAKETTVVMLGYDSCYWCANEKEILRDYLYDHDVNVKYLDISLLSTEDFNELASLHDSLKSYGTPTFISVSGGKVKIVDTQGARGTTAITTMLDTMGVK